MIPEFVGRLPVTVPMRSLTRDEILSVMTSPKNALVKQFKAMFEMDGCQLEFTDEALGEIADQAMQRETGVRSLCSMFEQMMLDLRFDIASRKGETIVITAEFVRERLAAIPLSDGERRKRETA